MSSYDGNACCCAQRQRSQKRPWKALPMALVMALVPKCPLCLAAWFGTVGLASIGNLVTHVNATLFWALCLVGLLAMTAWLTLRDGWVGGAAAGVFAAMVVVGKLVAGGGLIGMAGVFVLAFYASDIRLFRAAATQRRKL